MANEKVNTFTFNLDFVTKSGIPFTGKFSIHRPTVKEMIQIGVNEARELVGLSNVDILSSNLARMVATFDVVIDSSPDWFKPRDLYEMEVLQEVYQKYVDYLSTFQIKSKSEEIS